MSTSICVHVLASSMGEISTFLGSNLSVLHPHSSWKGLHQLYKVVDYPITLNLSGEQNVGMNHKKESNFLRTLSCESTAKRPSATIAERPLSCSIHCSPPAGTGGQ